MSASMLVASRRSSLSDDAGESCCWICLEHGSSARPLCRPCRCPRDVHMVCLSRWCLQQAGRSEERTCRFCAAPYPDWKTVLTPPDVVPADPIMVVTLGDVVHRVRVKPGEDGQKEFQQEIRRLFQIPDEVEFEVTFRCRAPCTTDTIQLEGMSSYDAATHCASLMAAQRLAAAAAAGSANPNTSMPLNSGAGASHSSAQVAAPSEGQGHMPAGVPDMTPGRVMTPQQVYDQQQSVERFRYELQQSFRQVLGPSFEGGAFAAPGAVPCSPLLCPGSPALLAPLASAPSLSAATGSAAILHPSTQGLGSDPTCLSAAATPAPRGMQVPPGMIDLASLHQQYPQQQQQQQPGYLSPLMQHTGDHGGSGTPPSVAPMHAQMLGLLPGGMMPLMTLHQQQQQQQMLSQMAMAAASAAAAWQQALMTPVPQPAAGPQSAAH